MNRIERILLPLLTATILLILWTLAVKLTHTKIFPSPLDVARAIGKLAERKLLWSYMIDSLGRALAGYLAAVALGIPLGILLDWSQGAARAVNPVIQMLRPISPLAWMPLAVIWVCIGNAPPIFFLF